MSISKPKTCGVKVGNQTSVPSRYQCPSCKLLLRDPVQANCGHRYCKACIPTGHGTIGCFACQVEGEDPVPQLSLGSVHLDAAMSRELNRTEFACPWPGCAERRRLPDLLSHAEAECEHRQFACGMCDQTLAASRLEQHRDLECPNRLMQCELCKKSVPGNRMPAHLESECVGSTRQCESCTARVRDTEEARLSHARTDCPVRWVDNGPCPYGCGVVADARAHRGEFAALHLDRERIELLGLRKGSGQQQQVTEASGGATALEAAAAALEQPTTMESQLAEVVATVATAELAYSLVQFGLPHCSTPTGSTEGQMNFFNRLQAAFTAGLELEEEQRSMEQKLSVAYRSVDPLVEQKQREFEQMLSASDIFSKLALEEERLVERPLSDLDRRISLQELGSTDGVLVWKIAFVHARLADTEFGHIVYSPFLFTDKFGYKLSAVAYLNGHSSGRGSHLSLYCRLCQGPYDAVQRWPFRRVVTFTLLDQSSDSHRSKEFRPDQSSQFQRPGQALGQPFGYEKFLAKEDLETKGFLKDDALFVRIQVSKPTLN